MTFVLLFLAVTLVDGLEDAGWEGATDGLGLANVESDLGDLSPAGETGGWWRRSLCGYVLPTSASKAREEGMRTCEAFMGVGVHRGTGVASREVWFDVLVALPTVLFVMFLASHLRASVAKLRATRNHVMATYYTNLWFVCILNLLRCGVQMWQASPLNHVRLWNALWLATRFGMDVLEVSAVVYLYLAHGHSRTVGAAAALRETIVIAVGIAGIDLLAKSALIFGFGVEVFVEEPGLHSRGYFWTKWGYWATRAFIAALVYGVLTALPKTRYRDWMPARPSFYGYTGTLFVLYAVETVCALCVGGGVSRWAYCVFGLCNYAYYACYPPVLYLTFLADYFREDEYEVESRYYSEMEEAGYFDDLENEW